MNQPNSAQSLDELLADIQRDAAPIPPIHSEGGGYVSPTSVSAGMGDISAHIQASGPAPAYQSSIPTQTPLAETNEVWDTHLTERQRQLPKLDLRMFGSLVALVLFVVGVGSATYLTQNNQDLRNQAYEETLPDVAGTSATLTQAQTEASARASTSPSVPEGESSSFVMMLKSTYQQKVNQLVGDTPRAQVFATLIVAAVGIVLILGFVVWAFVV